MPTTYPESKSAGPSRKRSYAQITKSESPGNSPDPPAKRRRTEYPSSIQFPSSSSSSSSTSAPHNRISRFIGDGLDLRRPVMSARDQSISHTENTIDLTLDDDTPPPSASRDESPLPDLSPIPPSRRISRAPPFTSTFAQPEIIDLSLLDDDEPPDAAAQPPITSSPELEFVGERLRTPANLPLPRHASRVLPPPVPSLGALADIIRGATQTMFGALRYERDHEDLARLDGVPHGGQFVTYDPAANLTIYENVDLDYGAAGFQLGVGEDPQPPPPSQPDRTYKAPSTTRTGYTRTYEEDDVLVCGFCGDELAAGDDEVKAQVWIIKQCGHAYCGICAHNRVIGRSGNRDRKRTQNKNPFPFKVCTVPDCGKAVDSKTKMFQVYL